MQTKLAIKLRSDFRKADLRTEASVELVPRNHIKEFVENWHYSTSINGVMSSYCFRLTIDGVMVGAMIYGRPAMAGTWKKYAEEPDDVIELRRLCCIDKTPKNAESFFIGKTLRWLKNNTNVKCVVSYADPSYGHRGVIYQASNFEYRGRTSPGKVIIYNGRIYHDKVIRTKYKGELKPFAKELRYALDRGHANVHPTDGKHIYVYTL